jgi:hypothetical protein
VETSDRTLVERMFNHPSTSACAERKLAADLVIRLTGGPDREETGMPSIVTLSAEVGKLSQVPILSSWLCQALGSQVVSLMIGSAIVLNLEEDVRLALLAELANTIEITT